MAASCSIRHGSSAGQTQGSFCDGFVPLWGKLCGSSLLFVWARGEASKRCVFPRKECDHTSHLQHHHHNYITVINLWLLLLLSSLLLQMRRSLILLSCGSGERQRVSGGMGHPCAAWALNAVPRTQLLYFPILPVSDVFVVRINNSTPYPYSSRLPFTSCAHTTPHASTQIIALSSFPPHFAPRRVIAEREAQEAAAAERHRAIPPHTIAS